MARVLQVGIEGSDVRNLQEMLNFHFKGSPIAPLSVDSKFGAKTHTAVIALQRGARIVVDGKVGPQTIMALFPLGTLSDAAIATRRLDAVQSAPHVERLYSVAKSQSALVARCLPMISSVASASSPSLRINQIAPLTPGSATTPTFSTIKLQNLVAQAGNQFAWNPWDPRPSCLQPRARWYFAGAKPVSRALNFQPVGSLL